MDIDSLSPVAVLSITAADIFSDWHVDIADPKKTVVFQLIGAGGEAMANAVPMQVPDKYWPLLLEIVERLKQHKAGGDVYSFPLLVTKHLRFRGERIRTDRYALRRSITDVKDVHHLDLGDQAINTLMASDLTKGGLVLIAGEQGAGKSSTARSMIKSRLMAHGGYALAVESPIEVEFEGFHGKGYLEQVDATSTGYKYEVASAMRKFPAASRSMFFFGEVIEETAAAELARLAPRGNLVVTTIHSNSTENAIRMLIALAERGGETSARELIGSSLQAVIHQKLFKGKPTVKCLSVNANVRNSIRESAEMKGLSVAIDQANAQAASVASQLTTDRLAGLRAAQTRMRP